MKERILTGWTIKRLLYIGLGTAIIINSAVTHEWFGILFGAYFASMGVFAFGCAAGNCFSGSCNTKVISQNKTEVEDIELGEVKQK